MDTQNRLKTVLTTTNFGIKSKKIIIEFLCESIIELANFPGKVFYNGIHSLHKTLSNVQPIANLIHLILTKCIILHSIRLHFLDRINCSASLESAEINTLVLNYIKAIVTSTWSHNRLPQLQSV